MEHVYAIARATQKALISAKTEFHRELTTNPTLPQQLQPPHIKTSRTTTVDIHTPTITQTELNTLREAMYTGRSDKR